jgi:competence protein ComFA
MDEKIKANYYGRWVNVDRQVPTENDIEYRPALTIKNGQIKCQRCGGVTSTKMGTLPNQQFYCRKCINLGRVSTLIQLATIPEPNQFIKNQQYLKWTGQLTPAQATCSKAIINSIDQQADRLLWAVTGAGKTEMLFEGIARALALGKRVAMASPRVDVILELLPRLQVSFPELPMTVLHGREAEPYHYTQFTLCTTHQLLRFYHAFDVLIIDEVDSFPFAANQELHFAAQQARKIQGSTIYLTATPDRQLLKASRTKKLATSYLTQRFHGHPLPEIKMATGQVWQKSIQKGRLPASLKRFLNEQIKAQRQFLIFVPRIAMLPDVLKAVQAQFSSLKILTVYAEDTERIEKVQMMRDGEIDGLITTTILERGVTFPGIDVAVLGADDPIFSMAALVQIAGRVGRSPKRPTGTVLMISKMLNQNLKGAQRQIKFMNCKAKLK